MYPIKGSDVYFTRKQSSNMKYLSHLNLVLPIINIQSNDGIHSTTTSLYLRMSQNPKGNLRNVHVLSFVRVWSMIIRLSRSEGRTDMCNGRALSPKRECLLGFLQVPMHAASSQVPTYVNTRTVMRRESEGKRKRQSRLTPLHLDAHLVRNFN